jgi:hypothetical protein
MFLILLKSVSILTTLYAYYVCMLNNERYHSFSEYFSYNCSTTYYSIFITLSIMMIHCIFVFSMTIIIFRFIGMLGILTHYSKYYHLHAGGFIIHTISSIYHLNLGEQSIIVLLIILFLLVCNITTITRLSLTIECILIILGIYFV